MERKGVFVSGETFWLFQLRFATSPAPHCNFASSTRKTSGTAFTNLQQSRLVGTRSSILIASSFYPIPGKSVTVIESNFFFYISYLLNVQNRNKTCCSLSLRNTFFFPFCFGLPFLFFLFCRWLGLIKTSLV